MKSESLFEEAKTLFPSGVNSPVRYYAPVPVMFSQAKGSKILDVNNKEYIDYSLGFGPMILGHSNYEVNNKIKSQIDKGILFGSITENEIILGKLIKENIKSIEKMRFTNSGTEATMHAIRAARGFTGRKYILKMEGGYHGAHDYALIKSGSGTMTFGVPSSAGIPEEVSKTVLVGQYNDQDSIEALFREHGNEIAAVITEPVLGNIGVINPENGFLQFLREITQKYSSLLIFDEVITGFRFAFRGYQDIINVKPDLTTLGKIIGGGAPVGLFGGRQDIMDNIAPSGNIYEAGTFSGNPLTMAAGIATLQILKNKDYTLINNYSAKIEKELNSLISEYHLEASVNRCYSMFQLFFNREAVNSYKIAKNSDAKKFFKMFRLLLDKGIFLPPSQFETEFVSFAHTSEDLAKTIESFSSVLKCL
ncbi:MAG: glutamate-1-semialdehyde 2,1-aminomutase [Ferroplasma sp.]